MKHIYSIKSQTENDDIKVYMTATTKRSIESKFNWLMKYFAKNPLYYVQPIRIGYYKVTYIGGYVGNIETEYWIERA